MGEGIIRESDTESVRIRIMVGDSKDVLSTLPSRSAQCAVTSPPYFGLRSYLPDGHHDKSLEIGFEQTPDSYVAALVGVFREMRRVLADDGVFWLNIGDSYASSAKVSQRDKISMKKIGVKPKDLLMIPARVALALQADGWYLRSHCIWHKPNPMPESVRDRPTSAHESVFLLTKNARYFYDSSSVSEPSSCGLIRDRTRPNDLATDQEKAGRYGFTSCGISKTRNLRNVWTITPRPFRGAHFATFPTELAERCIKAGSRPGDTIIDPFFGAGTTAMAAQNRSCIGIDINERYAELAAVRLSNAGLVVNVQKNNQMDLAI